MHLYPLADLQRSRHPCFTAVAQKRYGRVHLPIAPACNLKCAYCNGKYDCPNENRPGLASRIIEPGQVADYLFRALRRCPAITVVGIAGPGDPFYDPDRTLAALAEVRALRPDLSLCVATNGLNLSDSVNDLVSLDVGFVTVTVNAVQPEIGRKLYTSVRLKNRVLGGLEAAGVLLDRQLSAISSLKAQHIVVKVNTVVVPDLNDAHIPEIAGKLSGYGVDLMNLIPLIPLPGTLLADYPAPSMASMERLRRDAEFFIPQMHHCVRCRADAAGFLACDQSLAITAV
jgi:nitrogen fixation protein NifB